IANLTAFATSQPRTRIRIASSNLGRKAPTWCNDSRTDSSSMLTSIAFSSFSTSLLAGFACARRFPLGLGGGLDGTQQTVERNAHPVRAIVDFVLELIHGLLEHEQLEQTVHFRACGGKAAAARNLVVSVEEGRYGMRQPLPAGGFDGLARVG